MNINNGKTGNVNIPGALHSTGGDGDGQVGGVVAYAGDVYDETLGKNQKEINQTLLNGSGDSNVIAVALNDLNEKVEEQEKVTSSGLNDLNDKTDNLGKDIENLEKTTSSSLNDLNDKVNNLNDKVDNNEKTTSASLNDLNEKVDNLSDEVNDNEAVTAAALNDLDGRITTIENDDKIVKLNNQNSVSMGTELVTDGKESIAGGAGVYIKGNRSFGYGSGLTVAYLTGNNGTYNLMIKSSTSYGTTNKNRNVFADIFTNTYLRDANTLERVAKILTVTANSDGQPITITTDTDLGEITSKSFGLENVTGDKSFTSGVFGNTGIWSNLMGYMNFSNKDYVNALGTQITNSGTYANLFGTGITNTDTISNIIGYNVSNKGKWSSLIGYDNINTNQSNTIIGNTNTINGTNSSIIGQSNTVNENCRASIIGEQNVATKSSILSSDKKAFSWMLGSQLTTSFDGIALGYLNKDYPEETTAANQNFFVIGMGNGSNNDRANGLEIKANGDLYIDRIGGYNGKNSTSSSVIPLQTIISDLQTKSTNTDTIINNHFTDNNSIKVGTAINVSGIDSIAGGAGVSLTGNRAFGYGTSMGAIYLTGNNGSYSARLYYNSNYTNANNIGSVFAVTHLNSYLLNTSNFSRVAKITNIVYNGENQPLTLTLDTDLGNLSDAVYAIENVAGTKSFNGGSFGNTGQNSSVIGHNNFNTGNTSNILGSVNANTAGTATVLGYLNKNTGANSNVFGSLNNNSGTYGNVIGLQNTNSGQYANIVGRNNNNKCASTNILGIANIVNETTYPSSILGFENNADATTQQFTLGYQNHGTRGQYAPGNVSASFMFGHHLITSSSCYAIGKYNKDYDVQDVAKQNFFVVGQGDSTRASNNLEVKNNGNWYVYGVGGFDGTNSDNANVKTLQTVITELTNKIIALENQLNGGNS